MTRLEVILETVSEILEGSKRNWSKKKRSQHAAETSSYANERLNRAEEEGDKGKIKKAREEATRAEERLETLRDPVLKRRAEEKGRRNKK
jgi:hypothetical protein